MEMKLDVPGGSLYFDFRKPRKNDTYLTDSVVLLRGSSHLVEAIIPEKFEIPFGPRMGEVLPVSEIARKAFLGSKKLKRVILPDSIREIGEWAFASCKCLSVLELGCGTQGIIYGTGVFLNCQSLKQLRIRGKDDQVAALLASVAPLGEAAYLLDEIEAGSREWYRKFDARLWDKLTRPDEEGFSKQILCGEEDYGSTNKAAYESSQRREKVRFIFLRLINDSLLGEDLRKAFVDYLLEHTAGMEQEETWRVILEEKGQDRDWYDCFARLGCLTEDNRDRILSQIGGDNPEMKAFFLEYLAQKAKEDFSGLSGENTDQSGADGESGQFLRFFSDLEL